nr:MAG TPA: hypothetical protein [Caudoviricetes sp.]
MSHTEVENDFIVVKYCCLVIIIKDTYTCVYVRIM